MKFYFLVAVFNEEKNISKLLKSLGEFGLKRRWDFSVIIVNDGSTDGTKNEAEKFHGTFPIKILDLEKNQGPGAAFKAGFNSLLNTGDGEGLVITLEGDGTSDLSILDEMVAKALSGCDVVLASCHAKGGVVKNVNIYRTITTKVANFMLKIIVGVSEIKTYSCFYRVYRLASLRRVFGLYGNCYIEEKGFAFALELLLKFIRSGAKVTEVPVVLDWGKRLGKSKMRTIPTIKAYLRIMIKEFLRMIKDNNRSNKRKV